MTVFSLVHCFLIESLSLFGPQVETLVCGLHVLQMMNIPSIVDPLLLMQTLVIVAARRDIALYHPCNVCSDELFDDLPGPRVMGRVRAQGRRPGTPDGAILPIVSPSVFIGLHGRTGTDLASRTGFT